MSSLRSILSALLRRKPSTSPGPQKAGADPAGPRGSVRKAHLEVVVIGSGVGGLALARALLDAGISARVYERRSRDKALAGAGGLMLQCNASAVLDLLSTVEGAGTLGSQLAAAGGAIGSGGIFRPNGERIYYDEVAPAEPGDTENGYCLGRPALQSQLLASLPPGVVTFGRAFRCYEQLPSGRLRVCLGGSGEEEEELAVECDVLVGADGVRSAVRAQLFGAEPSSSPASSPSSSLSSTAPSSPSPSAHGGSSPEAEGQDQGPVAAAATAEAATTATAAAGTAGGGASGAATTSAGGRAGGASTHPAQPLAQGLAEPCPLRYSGSAGWQWRLPLSRLPGGPAWWDAATGGDTWSEYYGKGMRCGWFDAGQGLASGEREITFYVFARRPETWEPGRPGEELAGLRQLLQGLPQPVPQVLGASEPTSLYVDKVYDRDPLPGPWGRGPVTLLGDAAHPLLPALGQGACMAVEDGFELANGLGALLVSKAGDAPTAQELGEALRSYEAARAPRVSRVCKHTRKLHGQAMYNTSLKVFMRDWAYKLTPKWLDDRGYEYLEDYEPAWAPGVKGPSHR